MDKPIIKEPKGIAKRMAWEYNVIGSEPSGQQSNPGRGAGAPP